MFKLSSQVELYEDNARNVYTFYYFYDYMLTIFTLKFEKTLYKETL